MAAPPTGTKEPREIELKLRFPPAARARLESHPALQTPGAPQPEERDEVTQYFDTPTHALTARGLSLRVRHANGEHEQTVKAVGEAGVAAQRGEWTWSLDDDAPDLGRLAELDAELPDQLAGVLRPTLRTEIHRIRRKARIDGAVVEADLDVGRIVAGDRSEEVAELELELVEGEVADLYRLALELHADLPLVIETASKAERGRWLAGECPPTAEESRELEIAPDLSAAGALRAMVRAGVGQFLGNLRAAGAGDAEAVHQARIALRRLRTAFVLFGPRLQEQAVDRFNDEIRRVGRVFGEARDWDVFVLETLPAIESSRSVSAWLPLVRRPAEAARRTAHDAVAREINEPALTGLVLSLAAWAEDGAAHPEIVGRGLDSPIARVAPSLLDRLADKLDKRGRHLEDHSREEQHALRKTLKKMRYGVDALASLHGRKAVRTYLKRCKALQKILGDLNDAAVTVTLAERLASARGGDLTPALGALAQWSEENRRRIGRGVGDAWSALQKADRFWQ